MQSTLVSVRRHSLALSLLLAVAAGVFPVIPQRAQAQLSVACVNCSDVITQILGYVEQLTAYVKQVQQYSLQIQQYQNMLKNNVKLPRTFFDQALGTIRNIEGTLRQGTNISYAMSNLDSTFRAKFPDYQSVYQSVRYLTEAQSMNDQARRSQEAMDAARTVLLAARDQSNAMVGEQSAMDAIGGDLIGADGRLDAIQAAGEYAQHSAQQIMKMRQIGLMQVQLQSAQIAQQQRDQDLERAALARFVESKPAPVRATPNSSQDYVR